MYKICLKFQLVLFTLFYLFLNFKFWTKTYDPMFYDTLFLNKIPLFWFVHLTLGGLVVLGIIYKLFQKIDAKKFIFLEIFLCLILVIFCPVLELTLRKFPSLLPLPLIEKLGYTEDDQNVSRKLKHTVADKYVDDPELGILHEPNLSFPLETSDFSYHYQTDSKGFTNFEDETLYQQADIVTLGDSYTEGVGVPQNLSYPRQLANLLNRRILNLGHGSYDSYQYPIVLKRYGLTAKPKTVIVSFWCFNDFQNRYFYWNKANKEKAVSYRKFIDNGDMIQYRKENRKQLYSKQLFSFISTRLLESYKSLWDFGAYRGISINGKKISMPISKYIVGSDEEIESCLAYLKSVLSELKQMAKKNNFRLIVLYLPMKEEVYYRFIKNLPNETRQNLDWWRTPAIKAIQEMNVEVIDFTPPFIEAAKHQKQIYHTSDVHLNLEGYSLVASTLNTYLKK